jgi:hypothetical protein
VSMDMYVYGYVCLWIYMSMDMCVYEYLCHTPKKGGGGGCDSVSQGEGGVLTPFPVHFAHTFIRARAHTHTHTHTNTHTHTYTRCVSGAGAAATTSYQKRVEHDSLVSQPIFRETYQRLKASHKHWAKHWPEKTDPQKFVFEETGIAAYLVWKFLKSAWRRRRRFITC